MEVDIPEGVDPAFENPDGPWLQLLDEQAPDWIRTSGVVNERTVLTVDG